MRDDVANGFVSESVVQWHGGHGDAVAALLRKHPLAPVLREEADHAGAGHLREGGGVVRGLGRLGIRRGGHDGAGHLVQVHNVGAARLRQPERNQTAPDFERFLVDGLVVEPLERARLLHHVSASNQRVPGAEARPGRMKQLAVLERSP